MSFFSKIVEKKGVVIAISAGVLALGVAILYKSYQNQGNQGVDQEKKDELDMQKQIQALKSQINLANPSLNDVKQVLTFSMNYAKKKIHSYSQQFKKKRQQYNNTTRIKNMKDYMNLVSNGMQQVRNIATNTQTQIMKQLGLNEAVFMKYQNDLSMFMRQLLMNQSNNLTKQLTLQEVKYAIRLQIQYLKTHGQQILQRILEVTKNWTPTKKSQLPLLLSVVIADGAYEDHPQIDQQAVQAAQMKLQHHLMGQLQQLQAAMTPLMRKLSSELGGFGMGGMGMDMAGMGMGGMGMGQQDPFGSITPQQMQQLQQLEQLRLNDPEAFEQMMRQMYG